MPKISYYKWVQILFILSFFLPFLNLCSGDKYKVRPEPFSDYATVSNDTIDLMDTLAIVNVDSSIVGGDSVIISGSITENTIDGTDSKYIWDNKGLERVLFGRSLESITGFALVILPFAHLHEAGFKGFEWGSFILPLIFLLSLTQVFISQVKRRTLLKIIDLITFLTLLILALLYMNEESIEVLYGWWVATVLALAKLIMIFVRPQLNIPNEINRT